MYLLDTHVFLWSRIEPERLGKKCRNLIVNPKTELLFSAVSSLEIAQLVFKGRVVIPGDLETWILAGLRSMRCQEAEIDTRIALSAYHLPMDFHLDPADRILVATARLRNIRLITADSRILDYRTVATVDARL